MVHTLAKEVMALNQQVAELDKLIEARFRDHHHFDVITSMPGLGIILGAEFLAATGGDMTVFGTADRLAGFGGVAPVPRDSGKISGNLRRPQRYNRRLQRVFYTSASPIQHPKLRGVPPLLRSQTRRRKAPHPGRPRSRPPPRQRPLGSSTRTTMLRGHSADSPRGLTNDIRACRSLTCLLDLDLNRAGSEKRCEVGWCAEAGGGGVDVVAVRFQEWADFLACTADGHGGDAEELAEEVHGGELA